MKKIGAAIIAAVSALVIVTNIPEGVTPTTAIVDASGGEAVFNIESSGSDRGLVLVVGYEIDAPASITAASVDGQAMTKSEHGYLQGVGVMETWVGTGFGTGTLPVTVTAGAPMDFMVSGVHLTDVNQALAVNDSTMSIGQGVPDSTIMLPAGNASLVIVMSMPFEPTVTAPGGFASLGTDTGTKARMTVLFDDDGSETLFDLALSQACHWGVIALGLNVAP